MLALFSFAAKAQTTGDSIFTVIDSTATTPNNIVVTDSSGKATLFAGGSNSDYSGRVGVGTNTPKYKLSIRDSLKAAMSIGNGKVMLKIGVRNTADTSSAGSGARMAHQTAPTHSDIIIGAMVDLNGGMPPPPPSIPSNDILWGCGGPNIFYESYAHYFEIVSCINSETSEDGNAYPPLQMLAIDHTGVTITTNDYSLGPNNGTTVNGDITVNGLTKLNDRLTNSICDNSNYTATITNCGGDGKGLLIKAGSGTSAGTHYPILEVEDYAGYPIMRVDGKDGFIYARDVNVTANAFPDYVFDSTYCRLTPAELDTYIQANHHLPEMPTAAAVGRDGMPMAATTVLLVKKIEELTLYMVQQQKEIDELRKQVATKH